ALARPLVHDLDHGRHRAVVVVGEHDALGGLVDWLIRRTKEAAARQRLPGGQCRAKAGRKSDGADELLHTSTFRWARLPASSVSPISPSAMSGGCSGAEPPIEQPPPLAPFGPVGSSVPIGPSPPLPPLPLAAELLPPLPPMAELGRLSEPLYSSSACCTSSELSLTTCPCPEAESCLMTKLAGCSWTALGQTCPLKSSAVPRITVPCGNSMRQGASHSNTSGLHSMMRSALWLLSTSSRSPLKVKDGSSVMSAADMVV